VELTFGIFGMVYVFIEKAELRRHSSSVVAGVMTYCQ